MGEKSTFNNTAMQLSPENKELRDKIIKGATLAYERLVISSAEKNEQLVIGDLEGNVKLVDAKELLKTLNLTEKTTG
jgi:hypothetical protein